ncbi:MAG: hypothetical protein IKV03_03390 [Alphaproteobacteria bacterium]|nr:hypothetical protein [Alphaproteobacteria bacterium]
MCQGKRSYILKMGVSLSYLATLIGGGALVWGMGYKKEQNLLTLKSEQTASLSQCDINKIIHSLDAELFGYIERYQNYEGMSPRRAVDNALYEMWKYIENDYKNNSSEKARICLMHITKRGKQANRMLLSNVVGDCNPFLEMLYLELVKYSSQRIPVYQDNYFDDLKFDNVIKR